jgi:hypothetical protein
MHEVCVGRSADDLRWWVMAGESGEGDFATYVWRERGGVTAASGMRGPKLYDGEHINTFFGQSDGMPPFVLVRAHSRVAAVTVA